MQTDRKKKGNALYKILTNAKVRISIICLCLSGALWLFVALGKTYQYNYSIPVSFFSSDNPNQQFYCSDSVIDIHITSSGFDLLTSRLVFRDQKSIDIDVNKLSLNMQSGNAKIPMGFINSQVYSTIGMGKVLIEIMPDTLNLKWNKTYSKQVPLINRVKVQCVQPFSSSEQPKLEKNFLELEGTRVELRKIDTLYTKEMTLKGINRDLFVFVPVEFDHSSTNLNLPMSIVGMSINVKEYTENVVSIPVSAIVGKNEKIRLFPSSVKVRYKVAMEDFKKVNPDDISAYVITNLDENKKKLRVILKNVPEFVKVLSIDPPKLDYIIQK